MFQLISLISKKFMLTTLVLFLILSSKAQVYYVSSSQGSDMNNGLSNQTHSIVRS